MIILPGKSAISEFRQQKVLGEMSKVIANCQAVEAHFIYFVALEHAPENTPKNAPENAPKNALDKRQMSVLSQLLDAETTPPAKNQQRAEHPQTRTVIPRLGTISPWATKATDIVHHCGLNNIRRIERGVCWRFSGTFGNDDTLLAGIIYDAMTESILPDAQDAAQLFTTQTPAPLVIIDLLNGGIAALKTANDEFGFALSEEEQIYLLNSFKQLGRNPSDVELMMFAQVNSEHCRHKIFNADWRIDGVAQAQTLFAMIRHTHAQNPLGTLSAYSDNAAALEGSIAARLATDDNHHYRFQAEAVHFTAKVETHNHPTAISPFAGAATGCGGEIRDEGATGRGGKPKAGLVGYSVSHLRLPDFPQPWEATENKPERIASPLQIMLEGPIGAAAFNNEFGRPNIAGYFRSFEQTSQSGINATHDPMRYGYHKPIMLAGGVGNIRPQHVKKHDIADGTPIVVLGGAAMLIGLGGGAASSVASGSRSESLDFASVQRGNPEMQRRCQEVIDACCARGEDNPIVSIHDVGAGGLCNALPELVHDSARGGNFELRKILNDEPGMSPMQIWCNESQERYVIAIDRDKYSAFEKICERERCLFSQVGIATEKSAIVLNDALFAHERPDDSAKPASTKPDVASPKPIDLPMAMLFGLPPKIQCEVSTRQNPILECARTEFDDLTLARAMALVLGFPTVGDKTFLVTIGDRSVSGLIARDQMVGRWQVPVADVGVTAAGYKSITGEAFAIGERAPIAVINAPASGRMALGEAITNIAAAAIERIDKIKLSANWMVAAGEAGEDAALFATVKSVALDICPQLGISIPVGKDSMSMKTVWQDADNKTNKVVAPLSLIISSFAPVTDVEKTLTPALQDIDGQTELWLLDLGNGKNRLAASILAQVTNRATQRGDEVADLDNVQNLRQFFALIQRLNQQNLILAYHDRSDGGLMTTLCEMAFASRCGLSIHLDALVANSQNNNQDNNLAVLFNEELGAVLQTRRAERTQILDAVKDAGLSKLFHSIGNPETGENIEIYANGVSVFRKPRSECHRIWSQTTWQMQRMRDNPICADQEYQRIDDLNDPGLFCDLSFEHGEEVGQKIEAASILTQIKPKMAILREQGVNGQLEMAAAFHSVGFEAVDVTMTDLIDGMTLADFKGIVACGGFSFGDVLGAGAGWGKSILFNPRLKDEFEKFFHRADTFSLGVCNGCQMMSLIKSLIPGATHWPKFLRNTSEQYEARLVMVEVCSEKSILFRGMGGSKFPVSVAHGEGRADFASNHDMTEIERQAQLCLRFVDNRGNPTTTYPYNTNGSIRGMTGFTNDDGRATIMMPHPERVFRTLSNSWHPDGWGKFSPWIKIFQNARQWVE